MLMVVPGVRGMAAVRMRECPSAAQRQGLLLDQPPAAPGAHQPARSHPHACRVQVKDIERTTNHDVKAIEYVLKSKFQADPELAKVGGRRWVAGGGMGWWRRDRAAGWLCGWGLRWHGTR